MPRFNVDDVKSISVPLYEELLKRIKSRYPRRGGVEGEIAKLQTVYNIVMSRTEDVLRLEELLRNLHPFYWRLLEIEFNKDDVSKAFRCLRKARRFAGKFWETYRYRILAARDPKELKSISAEGRGRILSLFKRCSRGLQTLRNLTVFMQKLPSINPEEPIVIVAGPPNVGKSTYVRSVSKAKPEVASYPFTTKQVSVGHRDYGTLRVQIIDTPGLLDRPVEEMNPIERRAVAALSELNGVILFLVDPTREAYMSLERQLRLAESVRVITGGKPLFIGINKRDVASTEEIERAKSLFGELLGKGLADDLYVLSAINADEAVRILDDIVFRVFKAKNP